MKKTTLWVIGIGCSVVLLGIMLSIGAGIGMFLAIKQPMETAILTEVQSQKQAQKQAQEQQDQDVIDSLSDTIHQEQGMVSAVTASINEIDGAIAVLNNLPFDPAAARTQDCLINDKRVRICMRDMGQRRVQLLTDLREFYVHGQGSSDLAKQKVDEISNNGEVLKKISELYADVKDITQNVPKGMAMSQMEWDRTWANIRSRMQAILEESDKSTD